MLLMLLLDAAKYTVNCLEHLYATDDDRSQGLFVTLQTMWLLVLMYMSDIRILFCLQVCAFLSSLLPLVCVVETS